jgi:F-type H+-transporting ATPase subunit b
MELFSAEFLHAQVFWTSLAFVILLLFIWRFVVPVIIGVLDERIAKIRTDLDKAEQLRLAAEKDQFHYEEQLANAKAEAAAILKKARLEAQNIVEARTRDLEADLQRKADEAHKSLDRARAQASHDLKREVAELVLLAAEKVAGSALDKQKAATDAASAIKSLVN